eukprot:551339-Pyramimonas_sp.AAC.1
MTRGGQDAAADGRLQEQQSTTPAAAPAAAAAAESGASNDAAAPIASTASRALDSRDSPGRLKREDGEDGEVAVEPPRQ